MNAIRALTCGVVIAAAGFLAGRAFTEDGEGGATGPEYDVLKKALGEWTVKGTLDMGEGPQPTTAEARFDMMLGHYLVQSYESSSPMKFEGMGWQGWSPRERKYLTSWFDSMSPVPATFSGTWDEATKTLKSTGTGEGPEGPMPMRSEVTFKSDDEFTLTEWATFGGTESKFLELTYSRKK
jgi:hypothetical protein